MTRVVPVCVVSCISRATMEPAFDIVFYDMPLQQLCLVPTGPSPDNDFVGGALIRRVMLKRGIDPDRFMPVLFSIRELGGYYDPTTGTPHVLPPTPADAALHRGGSVPGVRKTCQPGGSGQ